MKVLSLDIGGTNTRAAIVDEEHRILKTSVLPTVRDSKEKFLDNVKKTIEGLGSLEGLKAIGGGVPGRVRKDGYVYALPNVGISDIPLAAFLSQTYGLPAHIANDAEIAALAEANLGAYKGASSLYFVTVSTGVGGALTVGGKLRETSYEVGHSVFLYDGRYIEFEKYGSGGGIVRVAKKHGLEIEGAKDLFALYRKGDNLAAEVLEDWVKLLASFFNMVQKDYEPEVFALTGGVTKSSDCFLERLKELTPGTDIRLCSFKEEAGLQGGAVLAFQNIQG